MCVACNSHAECGANTLCLSDGSCHACTVTCPAGTCAGTQLQAALTAGGTIYVCPGRYTGNFNTFANYALIGAGDGSNEASNTILDALNSGRALTNGAKSGSLARVRLTGAEVTSSFGGGIYHVPSNPSGTLTMTECTVADNVNLNTGMGAGVYNQGTLNMTRCTVTENEGSNAGGGLHTISTLSMTNCQITNNRAGTDGGGIRISGGTAILDGCTVSGNTAGTTAGGVSKASAATLTLLNGTTISGNNPNNCGGSVSGCTG